MTTEPCARPSPLQVCQLQLELLLYSSLLQRCRLVPVCEHEQFGQFGSSTF